MANFLLKRTMSDKNPSFKTNQRKTDSKLNQSRSSGTRSSSSNTKNKASTIDKSMANQPKSLAANAFRARTVQSENSRLRHPITYLGHHEKWRLNHDNRKKMVQKTRRLVNLSNCSVLTVASLLASLMLIGLPGILIAVILGAVAYEATNLSITNRLPKKIVKILANKLKPIDFFDFHRTTIDRTQNLIQGICQIEGVPIPELLIYDDSSINALLLAFSSKNCIILTKGAVEKLNRIEMEAVIAFQIGKIKSNICAIQILSLSTTSLAKYLFYLKPLIRNIDISFGLEAEMEAIRITKYPPGIIQVFRKSKEQPQTYLPTNFTEELKSLWMIKPSNIVSISELDIESKLDLLEDL